MSKLTFSTTPEQILRLPSIMDEMLLSDLSLSFVEKVIAIASECEGVFGMAQMWADHRNEPLERDRDLFCIVESLWDWEA